MSKKYYSSRNKLRKIDIQELYSRVQHLFFFFQNRDYFKEKAGITETKFSEAINHEAALSIGFEPFPIMMWPHNNVTEDNILDFIEFMYDRVSKPGEWVGMTTETGYNYYDYESYDTSQGQLEFREKVNDFLGDYKSGFELNSEGMVLAEGTDGLQNILNAEIEPYDEKNVDKKVRDAIQRWRNRHLDINERRQAIRELADVFEWLKKSKKLEKALNRKDEAVLFDIANNFAIRHHNPNQKRNYDQSIWYSWIFHFYLATYHAVIRLLKKIDQ